MKSTQNLLMLEQNWEKAKVLKIQQKKDEWIEFISIIMDLKPTNILEIGSYDGGTTMSLSLLCKNLITIDILSPRYDTNLISKNCNFTYIQGDSTASDIVNLFNINKNLQFDVLFIDGGHYYDSVSQDYYNYGKFVKSGGIIAFHDIVESEEHKAQNVGVYKLWKELKNNFQHIEIIKPPLEWGGIGLIWMP